jgi:3-keto-disaccharide hydrolase
MQNGINHLDRRTFVRLAGVTAVGCSLIGAGEAAAEGEPRTAISLFDGKTLDGWIQLESGATLSIGGIEDTGAFAGKLANGQDAVSIFLRGKLEELVRADLAAYAPSNANAKALVAALVKDLNQVIAGPPIYDKARFSQVDLRPETEELLKQELIAQSPTGLQLARLNKMLIEDAYPAELTKSAPVAWVVKDGAIASTGIGRSVMYTANDYNRYRLMLTMRHLSGNPDHYACILLFCARPLADEKPMDALGGIQFGLPNGNHWDYRGGGSNLGDAFFTTVTKVQNDPRSWSQIELLVDAPKGTVRMAVAQPPGGKAVEVLDFKDPIGGKAGPIALQMHNPGLFDEYKDLSIELDPKDDRLITVG